MQYIFAVNFGTLSMLWYEAKMIFSTGTVRLKDNEYLQGVMGSKNRRTKLCWCRELILIDIDIICLIRHNWIELMLIRIHILICSGFIIYTDLE